MIACEATGLVYRNPKPHLRAVHAWHPSLALLDSGELLCAFDLGQAVESLDYRTYISRSNDAGRTWSAPAPLLQVDRGTRHSTHTVRISRLPDGSLIGFGARFYRDDPEAGLTNRETMGMVPMDLIQSRSDDGGRTWQPPRVIDPPLVGPAFEVCHAVVPLSDGRLLAPTQTWRGWDGEAPNGMKAIALVSEDGGARWPRYLEVMNGVEGGLVHFEQSLVQLSDGRLLAVTWSYHETTATSRPTPYTLSNDGRTFSAPKPTGLNGQTAKLLALPDNRVLCLYRRDDKPGLWANLARIEGDEWVNLEEQVLWQGAAWEGNPGTSTSDRLGSLKFGFPQLQRLPDGSIFAVFWCREDEVYNIRWLRLNVA